MILFYIKVFDAMKRRDTTLTRMYTYVVHTIVFTVQRIFAAYYTAA